MEGGKVKPYLLQTLKEIALLGAMNQKVEISSLELARKLDASQQTASRYLLELDTEGYITRESGVKKQLVSITESGVGVLQEEYAQYTQMFELGKKVRFMGKLVSGLGEGKYYTSQEGYREQFEAKLHFVPYPGTLNVEIQPVERNKLRLLKNYGGVCLEEFKTENRTFGEVRCYQATINGMKGAIVLPTRSHYSTIIEVISPQFLRKKLELRDGDEVEIVVMLEK